MQMNNRFPQPNKFNVNPVDVIKWGFIADGKNCIVNRIRGAIG